MTDLRTQLQTTLGADYTLERELGGGSMSRVFVARDNALGRDVVVKVLSPELSASLSAERFTREIKLAAALQEPHIVPVLAAGMTSDGVPYYTMPFVRGDSLRARMLAGRIPFDESRAILRNVAQALAYAHAQGIVHRDIKPDNVLLSSGTAVVTDFGIAKALAASKTQAPGGTITQVGTSLGTPAYMAPEQAAGDDVDARADLYAWGVMAYEMLAGQHPFRTRTTAQQLIAAHIAEAPAPLIDVLDATARREPAVRALATLVMQCLEKQPNVRPDSAAGLLTAMDVATTSGSSRAPLRAPSRTRLVAAGVAMALVAIAAVTYLRTRPSATTASLAPKRVVIATFENKSGDASLDPIGAMAADWIARGLLGTGIVDVGGTAADLAARGVASRAAPGESPLQALARDANAGIVISGAYYRQGDSVLFQADFTDANKKLLVQTVGPISALATAPLAGVERLRQRVIAGLAPLVDSTLLMQATLINRPPSIEAYREFLEGEAAFYVNYDAAVAHFFRAAAQDSTYALPLIRSLIAVGNHGNYVRGDSVKRVLLARRAQLTPFEQAYLDYAGCEHAHNCVAATAAMVRLTPQSQFTAYVHAIQLRWNNQLNAADSIMRGLDPKSGELRGRIFLPSHHTGILHSLGVHDRELVIARAGSAQYPGRLYVAISEIRALIALGRLNEANRSVDAMFSLAPDLRGSALWFAVLAMYELRWHGHPAEAEALGASLRRRADAQVVPVGDAPGDWADRRGRLELLAAMHRWPELEASTAALLRADPANIQALRLRGVALAMQGKRADALGVDSVLATATALARSVDMCAAYSSTACRRVARVYIAAALGDQATAMTLLDDRTFDSFRTFYEVDTAHYDLLGEWLRAYPPFQAYITPHG